MQKLSLLALTANWPANICMINSFLPPTPIPCVCLCACVHTCASMNVCMCCYCILCSDPCFLSKDGPTLFARMVWMSCGFYQNYWNFHFMIKDCVERFLDVVVYILYLLFLFLHLHYIISSIFSLFTFFFFFSFFLFLWIRFYSKSQEQHYQITSSKLQTLATSTL